MGYSIPRILRGPRTGLRQMGGFAVSLLPEARNPIMIMLFRAMPLFLTPFEFIFISSYVWVFPELSLVLACLVCYCPFTFPAK